MNLKLILEFAVVLITLLMGARKAVMPASAMEVAGSIDFLVRTAEPIIHKSPKHRRNVDPVTMLVRSQISKGDVALRRSNH